jgi:hypothetical protein
LVLSFQMANSDSDSDVLVLVHITKRITMKHIIIITTILACTMGMCIEHITPLTAPIRHNTGGNVYQHSQPESDSKSLHHIPILGVSVMLRFGLGEIELNYVKPVSSTTATLVCPPPSQIYRLSDANKTVCLGQLDNNPEFEGQALPRSDLESRHIAFIADLKHQVMSLSIAELNALSYEELSALANDSGIDVDGMKKLYITPNLQLLSQSDPVSNSDSDSESESDPESESDWSIMAQWQRDIAERVGSNCTRDGCYVTFNDRCTMQHHGPSELSADDFQQQFLQTGLPVMLRGWAQTLKWDALHKWTHENLATAYSDEYLRVNDNDMTMKQVMEAYEEAKSLSAADRSRFGIINADILFKSAALTRDYSVPELFVNHDVFDAMHAYLEYIDAAGSSFSPRYFIIGPKYSGTTLHHDFWNTSFFNALAVGEKHWLTFPPQLEEWLSHTEFKKWTEMTNYEFFTGRHSNGSDDPADYDLDLSRRVRHYAVDDPYDTGDEASFFSFWNSTYMKLHNGSYDKPDRVFEWTECTQQPGDIYWSSGGWYHNTINLAPSSAVSHNVIDMRTFNVSMDMMCFDTTDQMSETNGFDSKSELIHIGRSMYLCASLSKFQPDLFLGSCCASDEYLEHLDSFKSIHATSSVHAPANTATYAELLQLIAQHEIDSTETAN